MYRNAVTFSSADKAQRAAAARPAAATTTTTAPTGARTFSSGTEDRVNAWLRDDSTDISPLQFVLQIADAFLHDVDRFDLSTAVDTRTFERTLCQAMGAYYLASERNKTIEGPREIRSAPKGWTADAENVWNDYVTHYFFNDKYWLNFWDEFPVAAWEHGLPQWRVFLQSLLPFYLHRDPELLEVAGMLVKNADGAYVSPDSEIDWDDAEPEE
jgi:hypothetical protein